VAGKAALWKWAIYRIGENRSRERIDAAKNSVNPRQLLAGALESGFSLFQRRSRIPRAFPGRFNELGRATDDWIASYLLRSLKILANAIQIATEFSRVFQALLPNFLHDGVFHSSYAKSDISTKFLEKTLSQT
jgi:hypothetical protein